MKNSVVHCCENLLCIYCYGGKCFLDAVELDTFGVCNSFMLVNIPEKVIKYYKIKHLQAINIQYQNTKR